MKHEPKAAFANGKDSALTLLEAMATAKSAIAQMTDLPVDSVAHCTRGENLNWDVTVDVIESRARMGDNDLLATYRVEIGPKGDMESFSRLRRYHREDRDA